MPTTDTPDEIDAARINLRTSAEAKALIERAAAYMGTSVSAFMVQNAYDAAKKVVAEHELLMLTQRDFKIFAKALAKPSAPTAALKRLMRG